ncbi:hypothetical protein, partial [Streptococcus pseudopneumoniae]|uniref:hypothetical protein n=1 Tax=Streptococcus pseudopneumoniae TaxID=257758 RepID=UPI001486BA71
RQSLLYLFEPIGYNDRHEELPPAKSTRRQTRPLFMGFARGYALATLWVVPLTSVFLAFGLTLRDALDKAAPISQNPDGIYYLFALAFLPLTLSFWTTPPLCVCRVLPLSAFQLFIRMLACPTIIFVTFAMTVVLIARVFTAWDLVHALAISYFVLGSSVLVQGHANAV